MRPPAIGDDALQKQAQGYVVPDSFTHGSSAQRVKWFRKGLVSGDINGGDTFNARRSLSREDCRPVTHGMANRFIRNDR